MSCKHNVFNKNQLGICIHVIELILALPVSGTDTITQQRQEMNYWRLRKEVNYSNANICIKNGQKSTTNSVSWRQNSLKSDMHINIWLSTLTEGRYKISLYCLEIFFTVFALASFENCAIFTTKGFHHNFDGKLILKHIVHSGNKSYDSAHFGHDIHYLLAVCKFVWELVNVWRSVSAEVLPDSKREIIRPGVKDCTLDQMDSKSHGISIYYWHFLARRN